MSYQKYLGYCPISNSDSQLYSTGINSKIPMNYLGYEVLANTSVRNYGSLELQELNHEMLVRFYTLKYIADITIMESIIDCIQGYLGRSIECIDGLAIRTIDNNSLSNLMIADNNCNSMILALKAYLEDYKSISTDMLCTLDNTTFINDECVVVQRLLRKIEYCSYFVLISAQNAIFNYYKIDQQNHQRLINGEIKAENTGDYIAKCFRPYNRNISFGLNKINFNSKYEKIDKWLDSVLPLMIERTHLPIQNEEIMVVSKLKKFINKDNFSLTALTNPFDYELKEGDVEAMIALEVFSLVTLLCWKSGLAWVPIIGSFVPYLDDGPVGRLLGVTVCLFATGFLTQNNIIQLKFVPQALFATNTTRMISILFLGLMLGGIFAI